jgi:hypothetical protein
VRFDRVFELLVFEELLRVVDLLLVLFFLVDALLDDVFDRLGFCLEDFDFFVTICDSHSGDYAILKVTSFENSWVDFFT